MKTWLLYWLGLQASQALAQVGSPPPNSGLTIQNPLSCDEATECVQSFLGALIWLAAPIAAVMVLIGGYQILASGGNEEKLRSGKNTIIYATVGYAVILLASAVVAVIRSVLTS